MSHLGHSLQVLADLSRQGRGFLQAGTFGRVDHHLKLALIVKREHFNGGQFKRNQSEGGQEQEEDQNEKNLTRFFLFSKRERRFRS